VAAQLASSADRADMGPVEQARLIAVGEVVALGDLSDAGRLRSLIEAAELANAAPATWPSTCSPRGVSMLLGRRCG